MYYGHFPDFYFPVSEFCEGLIITGSYTHIMIWKSIHTGLGLIISEITIYFLIKIKIIPKTTRYFFYFNQKITQVPTGKDSGEILFPKNLSVNMFDVFSFTVLK